jgi:hypothetical protein
MPTVTLLLSLILAIAMQKKAKRAVDEQHHQRIECHDQQIVPLLRHDHVEPLEAGLASYYCIIPEQRT